MIAAIDGDRRHLVSESADLLYHLLVVLKIARRPRCRGDGRTRAADRRSSGIAEKASRPT